MYPCVQVVHLIFGAIEKVLQFFHTKKQLETSSTGSVIAFEDIHPDDFVSILKNAPCNFTLTESQSHGDFVRTFGLSIFKSPHRTLQWQGGGVCIK